MLRMTLAALLVSLTSGCHFCHREVEYRECRPRRASHQMRCQPVDDYCEEEEECCTQQPMHAPHQAPAQAPVSAAPAQAPVMHQPQMMPYSQPQMMPYSQPQMMAAPMAAPMMMPQQQPQEMGTAWSWGSRTLSMKLPTLKMIAVPKPPAPTTITVHQMPVQQQPMMMMPQQMPMMQPSMMPMMQQPMMMAAAPQAAPQAAPACQSDTSMAMMMAMMQQQQQQRAAASVAAMPGADESEFESRARSVEQRIDKLTQVLENSR